MWELIRKQCLSITFWTAGNWVFLVFRNLKDQTLRYSHSSYFVLQNPSDVFQRLWKIVQLLRKTDQIFQIVLDYLLLSSERVIQTLDTTAKKEMISWTSFRLSGEITYRSPWANQGSQAIDSQLWESNLPHYFHCSVVSLSRIDPRLDPRLLFMGSSIILLLEM